MFNSMITKFSDWRPKNYSAPPYQHGNFVLMKSDSIWVLEKEKAQRTICANQVCCSIDYNISASSRNKLADNRLILIVRDSLRLSPFRWYEQVCTIATLSAPFDGHQLNKTRFSTESYVNFDRLSLKGTFNSEYVYPIAAYSNLRLMEHENRRYDCTKLSRQIESEELISCRLNYVGKSDQGIYSFGLYGRMYSRDEMPQ